MSLKINISSFKKNSMEEFEDKGQLVLIVNLEDKYHALAGKCTHLGCKLSKGRLDSNILTCPCHGSQFDVTNGKVVAWIPNWSKVLSSMTKKIGLAKDLKSFPAVVDKDFLFVETE
jgi:nitrite reductase/ring-hydroxylating ferredoxin subunit